MQDVEGTLGEYRPISFRYCRILLVLIIRDPLEFPLVHSILKMEETVLQICDFIFAETD